MHFRLQVGAEYQLEAYLSSYSNPTHQQAEAQCCDAGCNNDCDNLFLFCLREAGHSQDDESCPLGMMSTRDTLTDQEVFELGDGLDRRVTNPLAFTGESAWPVSFESVLFIIESYVTAIIPTSCICYREHFSYMLESKMMIGAITKNWWTWYLSRRTFKLVATSLVPGAILGCTTTAELSLASE